jgi:tetratricopeptide (TPR) repeat protein
MARGAAQTRRKRTKAEAARRRRRLQTVEPARLASQTMFFPKIRRQAKWVFLGLAVVFALGFTVFGVGSGGGIGLGDLFNNSNPTKGSVSESAARKRIEKNPNDAQAYRDLAGALETNGNLKGAAQALQYYTQLKPRDTAALTDLAGIYTTQGNRLQPQIQAAQQNQSTAQFNSGVQVGQQQIVGPDPIFQAVSTAQTTQLTTLLTAQQHAYTSAETASKRIVQITPRDAPAQLNLGIAAQQAGDVANAIAAYRRFLRLAPQDPSAPGIRREIKVLQKAAPTASAAG